MKRDYIMKYADLLNLIPKLTKIDKIDGIELNARSLGYLIFDTWDYTSKIDKIDEKLSFYMFQDYRYKWEILVTYKINEIEEPIIIFQHNHSYDALDGMIYTINKEGIRELRHKIYQCIVFYEDDNQLYPLDKIEIFNKSCIAAYNMISKIPMFYKDESGKFLQVLSDKHITNKTINNEVVDIYELTLENGYKKDVDLCKESLYQAIGNSEQVIQEYKKIKNE